MTRQHFNALAHALASTRPHEEYDTASAHEQWLEDVSRVANVCATFNRNFNRAQFLTACGVPNP